MSNTSRSTSLRLFGTLALALCTVGVTACDDNNNNNNNNNNTPNANALPAACRSANEPSRVVPPYQTGLVARNSGMIQLSLMTANPPNPIQGINELVVMVKDAQGQLLDGLTLSAKTWMPDHNHGSPKDSGISIAPATDMGPGHYRISNVNFHMAGYWEVTVDMRGTTGGSAWNQAGVFPLCIPS